MATKKYTVKNVVKQPRGFCETDGALVMLEPGQTATDVSLSDGELKNVKSTGYFSVDGGSEAAETDGNDGSSGGEDALEGMSTDELRETVEALTGKAPAKRTSRKKLLEMARAA